MQCERFHRAVRRLARLTAVPAFAAAAACSDSTMAEERTEQVVVVLNSIGISLTVVPLGSTNVRTIGIAPDGTPTTLAVRDSIAVVPMGITDVAAVVNLREGSVRMVALPAGSGATGVAFANDSIAVVANPGRNSVSPVNVRRATVGAEIGVGVYPQAVAADSDRVYVVNGNLGSDWLPAGTGTVTVLSAATLAPLGSVTLTGLNPGSAAVRGGQLFVLNAGTWGGDNSSLSVVNVPGLQEVRRLDGFGNFPGSVTTQPGRPVFVAAYGTGILVYDPEANAVVRGVDNPLIPGGVLPVATIRFDPLGLLYSLHPGDCTSPGQLLQMGTSGNVLAQVAVGVCPFALDFGTVVRGT